MKFFSEFMKIKYYCILFEYSSIQKFLKISIVFKKIPQIITHIKEIRTDIIYGLPYGFLYGFPDLFSWGV